MKIDTKELEKLVNEAVKRKIDSLTESTDFTAKRQIIHSAQQTSMEFEKEIAGLLDLVNPDDMPGHMQKRYFEYAEAMKVDIVKAVATAVGKFATLPRKQSTGE